MSAALGNQAGIASGLSTIATIQSNPQATLAPAQAGAYQQDISGLINALNTMNEHLLSAASSINQTVDGLKLTVCASGVTPGEPNRGFTGFDKGILADAGINPDEEAEEPDYSAVAGGGGTPPTNNGGRPPFVGGGRSRTS